MKNRASCAVLAVLILVLNAGPAASDGGSAGGDTRIELAGGEKGGTYNDLYAAKLVAALSGWKVSLRSTKGSSENLDLLADGKVDLAFAQADVFAQRMDEEPEHFGKLRVLDAFAEECFYVARRAAGGPKALRDLGLAGKGGEYPTISLGAMGGGMSESWNHIVTLIPSLAQVEVDHTAGTAALDRLAAGKIAAAAWVTDPANLSHKMLVAVRDNDALVLMNIDDPGLAEELPDGRKVYRVEQVETSTDPSGAKLTTACTEAMIFAGLGADPALVEAVTRAVPGLRR